MYDLLLTLDFVALGSTRAKYLHLALSRVKCASNLTTRLPEVRLLYSNHSLLKVFTTAFGRPTYRLLLAKEHRG